MEPFLFLSIPYLHLAYLYPCTTPSFTSAIIPLSSTRHGFDLILTHPLYVV
ncbi:hypothetical protein BDZ94DRAFT_1251138, partial [Collybia nuda]